MRIVRVDLRSIQSVGCIRAFRAGRLLTGATHSDAWMGIASVANKQPALVTSNLTNAWFPENLRPWARCDVQTR